MDTIINNQKDQLDAVKENKITYLENISKIAIPAAKPCEPEEAKKTKTKKTHYIKVGENNWNTVKENFPDLNPKFKDELYIKDEVFYVKNKNKYIMINNTGVAKLNKQ